MIAISGCFISAPRTLDTVLPSGLTKVEYRGRISGTATNSNHSSGRTLHGTDLKPSKASTSPYPFFHSNSISRPEIVEEIRCRKNGAFRCTIGFGMKPATQAPPLDIPPDIAAKCTGPGQFEKFDRLFRSVISVPKA